MKVISGKYKGRTLEGHNLVGTRPTMDRVKESLFASIQNYLTDSIVLDLFAGSGSLGIEALSEGASFAYLVDSNPKAIKTIKNNVNNIGIEDIEVIALDYKKALELLKDKKINLIFLDPPYQTNYIEKSIILIDEYNIQRKDGIIVCESDSLDKIIYTSNYEVLKTKKYGDKYIVIIKKVC